jgi:hypothetical protein
VRKLSALLFSAALLVISIAALFLSASTHTTPANAAPYPIEIISISEVSSTSVEIFFSSSVSKKTLLYYVVNAATDSSVGKPKNIKKVIKTRANGLITTVIKNLNPKEIYKFSVSAKTNKGKMINSEAVEHSSLSNLMDVLSNLPADWGNPKPIQIPTLAAPTVPTVPLAIPAFTLSSSSQSVAVGIAITTVTNTSTGGVIASYAISPAAPAGLTFSTTTGELSGSPTTMESATTYTITATNASGSVAQTFTLTVTIGAASKAMITTQPSGAVNAIALTTQPVIRITDLSENTITTSSSNVVASIASGTGTLTGTTTVAAVNGVATFTNLVITGTAGAFTLTFTPTSLTAATSSSLTLSAGAANRAAITRASVGTSYGVAFTTQPQITIQDASGNSITSSSAVVTVTVSAGGTLVGTVTASASSGVATFINLGIKGISGTTYTITYTASGLTAATQSVTLTALTIGAAGPGGGRIFYVAASEDGFSCGPTLTLTCYYLEAAPITGTNNWTDAIFQWSGNTTNLIGVTAQGTAVGAGYANTLAIVNQLTGGNTTEKAGTKSRAYRGPNDLSDWYLPSKDELNQMCKWQRGITGISLTTLTIRCTGGTGKNTGLNASGFIDAGYRSSSETSEFTAWYQSLATGGQQLDNGLKSQLSFYVRPIRAF